jgi:predicted RNA-binding Zn-ribbon protein involved in translation (DUF1610 family)
MKAKRQEKAGKMWCPYCDEEIMNSQLPYCQACKLEVFRCPSCGKVISRDNKTCPGCGSDIKAKAT